MDNQMEYYIQIKFKSLPRINFAVISHLRDLPREAINNNYSELKYVENGFLRFKLYNHNSVLELHDGDYAFFPADTRYEILENSGSIISASIGFFLDDGVCKLIDKEQIIFEKIDNSKFVDLESLYFPFMGKLSKDGTLYKMMKDVILCYDSMENYGNVNVSSKMICFLTELANSRLAKIKGEDDENLTATEMYCKKIDAYIEDNYSRVITMSIIASYMGLHENYISSIYKKNRGVTVMKRLAMYRVKKAKELIVKERYTMKAISEMVGFKDCKYFNAVFKKYENISPGKYVQHLHENKVYSYYEIKD